jgi:hypothetical protein
MPSCLPDSAGAAGFTTPIAAASAGVGVHTLAMLATTALVALVVYEWAGVGILRRAWLNMDALWTVALAATAVLLLVPR